MELYNLGYSPESITDALYKAALIVKDRRCGYKKQQAKAKAQAAASAEAAKEQLKEDAKDLLQKREQAAAAKAAEQKGKRNKDPHSLRK
jgi:hypothetical protein